jgi:hypothetical protein
MTISKTTKLLRNRDASPAKFNHLLPGIPIETSARFDQ